jgi:hypothetical protein
VKENQKPLLSQEVGLEDILSLEGRLEGGNSVIDFIA